MHSGSWPVFIYFLKESEIPAAVRTKNKGSSFT